MNSEGFPQAETEERRQSLRAKLANKVKAVRKKEGLSTKANDVGDLCDFVNRHKLDIPSSFQPRNCEGEEDVKLLAREMYSKGYVKFISVPDVNPNTSDNVHHLPFFVPLPDRSGLEETQVEQLLTQLNPHRKF